MPMPIPFPKRTKERRVQPGVRSLEKKRHALHGFEAVSLGELDFPRGKSSGTLEKVQRVESAFV
jgi:hypothetical protein